MGDMTEAEYRALPGLSGTGVAKLLESPADYRWEMDHPAPSTPAQSLGTLTHALVLGTEVNAVVSRFDSFRSQEAREWRDAQAANGIDVVTRADWDKAHEMADAVMDHREAAAILTAPGQSEVPVSKDIDGVRFKGRIDRMDALGGVNDLKTARDVSPRAMSRYMADYGTATQLAHYALIVGSEQIRPKIIAVRNQGRPAVAVYRIADVTWQVALDATRRAWDIYADCVKSGIWPDPHAAQINELELTPWALDALEGGPVTEVEVSL